MSEYYARSTALQAFHYMGDAERLVRELGAAGYSNLIKVRDYPDAPSPRVTVTDHRFDEPRRPDGAVKIDMYSGIWLVVPRKDFIMGFNDVTFAANFVAPNQSRVGEIISNRAVSSADILKGARP